MKPEVELIYSFVVDAVFSTTMNLADVWGHTALKGGEQIKW